MDTSCDGRMISMFFAGLCVGFLLLLLVCVLLWRFRARWVKKVARQLRLGYQDNNKAENNEKRKTYSLREPEPIPSNSPVLMRRKQTAITTNHVTFRSLNSSPCDVGDADVGDHVKLQSLYSAPRDLIPTTSRSSCLGQLGLADYMLEPDETDCSPRSPVSTRRVSGKSPATYGYNSHEDESPYSLVRYPPGGYPSQILYSPRNEYIPHSESRLDSCGSDYTKQQETFPDPRWSTYKSHRRSTCPDLRDDHRELWSQHTDPPQNSETSTANERADVYKPREEEQFYYTLENVNSRPISRLGRFHNMYNVTPRDSQRVDHYSSGTSYPFSEMCSNSLSETIMTECPYLRKNFNTGLQDKRKSRVCSVTSATSV